MKNKLFLIVGISTVLYIAALSGCQSISNKREANKINNSLLGDLNSLLEYIK
jgi:hypothetical protein